MYVFASVYMCVRGFNQMFIMIRVYDHDHLSVDDLLCTPLSFSLSLSLLLAPSSLCIHVCAPHAHRSYWLHCYVLAWPLCVRVYACVCVVRMYRWWHSAPTRLRTRTGGRDTDLRPRRVHSGPITRRTPRWIAGRFSFSFLRFSLCLSILCAVFVCFVFVFVFAFVFASFRFVLVFLWQVH